VTKKLLTTAALALAISAPFAQAQERWGGWGDRGEGRWERMRHLRMACEDGSERACWRLRRMRHEWRERRAGERGWDQGPREPDQRGWDQRSRGYERDRY
jgi:hypothetical protein